METHLNVHYRGKDIPVEITPVSGDNGDIKLLCDIQNFKTFAIELNKYAVWVIVGKQVINKHLIELIGDSYVNSLIW